MFADAKFALQLIHVRKKDWQIIKIVTRKGRET